MTTRYRAKNLEARALLDRPIHEEWIEFELDHMRRIIPGHLIKEFGFQLCDFKPEALEWDYWYDEQRTRGSHEIISLLSRMAEILPEKWHSYLHYGLTSSNVIDSCNHLRWRRLAALFYQSYGELIKQMGLVDQKSQQIKGMTHGRAATWTTLATRFGAVISAVQFPDFKYILHYPVVGGPTGAADPSQRGRQCISRSLYWPLWVMLAQAAESCAQAAQDYRFYCSDFGPVVGVTGQMTSPTSSSAMPNKRNPSDFERIISLAHNLKGDVAKLMTLPQQWLDRDLTHSAIERETIPELWEHAFFLVEEMTTLISTTKLELGKPLPPDQDSHEKLLTCLRLGMSFSQARQAASTVGS